MNLLINDTADAVIKRKSDGHVFVTGETQLASISQSLGINEKIWGGIGNRPLATIKGQKEVTASLRNAFYNKEFLAMTQGVDIERDGAVLVYKREDELKVTDNAGSLEVVFQGVPAEAEVTLVNAANEVEQVAPAANKVAIPEGFAEAGDIVSVVYKEEAEGDIIALQSDKFAEAYTIEYHTIGYDPRTNEVVKDIYIQLDHVIPSGDVEVSLENGSAIAPEINFDCLVEPGTKNIGRIIEVKRTP
jgi:hypothetical protein